MLIYLDVAHRAGVIIQGGSETLEKLSNTSHIMIDKTGTLTSSSMQGTSFSLIPAWQEQWDTFCRLVAAAEEHASYQPVAKAIFESVFPYVADSWVKNRDILDTHPKNQNSQSGVACEVLLSESVTNVSLGNANFMAASGVELDRALGSNHKGGIQVYVAFDGKHVATLTLQVTETYLLCCKLYALTPGQDTIKPDAKDCIICLQEELGLQVHMVKSCLASRDL